LSFKIKPLKHKKRLPLCYLSSPSLNSNTFQPKSLSASWWILIFLLTALLIGAAFISFHRSERRYPIKELPIGEVPDFSFTTQEGKTMTKADLHGKIWIADFIFTRCVGPCPMLTSRMMELSSKLAKNHEVKLISVSVDPAYDTPEVLADYARNIHANPQQWIFLTGPLPQITSFIQGGMKQPLAIESDGAPAHSLRLMVVDRNGMIRSYSDGNDPEVVQKILMKVGDLLREPSQK
jgi:protein SCO1/2